MRRRLRKPDATIGTTSALKRMVSSGAIGAMLSSPTFRKGTAMDKKKPKPKRKPRPY